MITPGTIANGRLLLATNQSGYANMRIYLDTISFSNTTIAPGRNGAPTTTRVALNFIIKTL